MTADNATTIFAAALSSGGLFSLIQFLIKLWCDKHDAKTKLLLGMARRQIISEGEAHINAGEISRAEYDDLKKYMYEPYRVLGGNGTAERVMREVEGLKWVTTN